MATLSSGRCFSGVNNAKLSADTKQHNMHHIEVLAEEIAVKVSKVLRTNEADVQACMECADGMLEASMVRSGSCVPKCSARQSTGSCSAHPVMKFAFIVESHDEVKQNEAPERGICFYGMSTSLRHT